MLGEKKEKITSPYLSNDIKLKKNTPFHAQWELIKLYSIKYFAHHPICSQYKNHYFKIGPLYLCVGCTSMYLGIFSYILSFFLVPTIFRESVWILSTTPFIGFTIAILHSLLKVKIKWFKAISRFLSGLSIGAFIGIIIAVPNWFIRFILGVFLILGHQLYGKIRGSNANRKKCQTCPLRNADPPCQPRKNTNIRIRKLYEYIDFQAQKFD
ncbi:MAG: hypothetical protein U9O98_00955 [Asgard group archaeon]|nr:hypothetical protein [Asgard group archaeon]